MSTSAQQITHITVSVFSGDLQELLARVGTHVEMARLRRRRPLPYFRGRPLSAQILFADDNADMRDCIRRRLAEQYKVETLGDGQASGARPGFGEQKDVDGSKELEHAARRTQRDSTEKVARRERVLLMLYWSFSWVHTDPLVGIRRFR
jgi:hypothetical protein